MAAPTKKRAVNIVEDDGDENNDSDSDSSGDESMQSAENAIPQEKIQVDFEGRNPIDSDFHGIKQLLHQLFLKAHINLSELTDLIISQNYVGSVTKQSFDVTGEDSDEEGDDDSGNDVFGITSVVNLTEKQNVECISQLRKLLLTLSREYGNDDTVSFVNNLLGNDAKPVGLIINERFVNIPAQISVPLMRSLSAEIKRAVAKKMPYDFGYYILICKFYKLDKKKKKQKKGKSEPDILWSNPEEEFMAGDAEMSFEFSVKNESDSGLGGGWTEDDAEMTPFRKVLIFKAEKLDAIIDNVEKIVNTK